MKQHGSRQDYYAKQARKEGYRSRSVYKLKEVQERFRIIKPGMSVLELGSAPGGWTQLLVKWVGKSGQVVVCDLLPMKPVVGATFIRGDFCEESVRLSMQTSLGRLADVVVSDMAPNITGDRFQDQVNMHNLMVSVTESLPGLLKPNGTLLVKLFQGSEFMETRSLLAALFKKVQIIKPKSSRDQSNEVYLLALGYQV